MKYDSSDDLRQVLITMAGGLSACHVRTRNLRCGTGWGLRPLFLISILCCLFVLLARPALVSGQKLPLLESKKETGAASQEKVALPATDEEIDKVVARIGSRLTGLRQQSAAAAEAAAGEKAGLFAATPDELRKQHRLLSELVVALDRHAQALRELKELRKTRNERSGEIKSGQGFTEKPPFPIAMVDGLRDSILAQRLDLEMFELRITVVRGDLQKFSKNLKESQKQVRLSEEQLEKSVGTPAEVRQRWLLDFARLQNDLNEASVASAETQRLMLEEAIAAKKEYISFLNQKLTLAEKVSPLSKDDFEKKLQELDNQRKAIEIDISRTFKKEEETKTALQKSRDALARALSGVTSGVEPSPKQLARMALLQSAVERDQALVEATEGKSQVMRGMLQLVGIAQAMWEDRYWLTQSRDIPQIREKITQNQLVMANIQIWKKFVETRLSKWAALIQSQREKYEKPSSTDEERKADLTILKAYEERQALLLRVAEALGRGERLANRTIEELKERQEHAPLGSRAKGLFSDLFSFVKKIWNTELYVAEEAIIAEGNRIVKPIGVTVGKVIQALIILIAGTWVARRLIRPIRWIVVKKLNKDESLAQQIGKVTFLILFLCVLLFSLISVNIPLAVFAFLGGALAIGLGFGGQHIISNFISSLILLFDRSIKVGDIVEIDGQGGRVLSIGMRSSHIMGFDGTELLVPNSQFLQQKVTNWTLSEKKRRYQLSVGVAYGSQTRKVSGLILKAVEGHPLVLEDPEPVVLFENFAESSLTFSVYFWLDLIAGRDNRIVLSDVRHRITELLDEAGIVISFPQRDVHLGSAKPIEIKIVSPEDSGMSGGSRKHPSA